MILIIFYYPMSRKSTQSRMAWASLPLAYGYIGELRELAISVVLKFERVSLVANFEFWKRPSWPHIKGFFESVVVTFTLQHFILLPSLNPSSSSSSSSSYDCRLFAVGPELLSVANKPPVVCLWFFYLSSAVKPISLFRISCFVFLLHLPWLIQVLKVVALFVMLLRVYPTTRGAHGLRRVYWRSNVKHITLWSQSLWRGEWGLLLWGHV
jgi:hypothetical protein